MLNLTKLRCIRDFWTHKYIHLFYSKRIILDEVSLNLKGKRIPNAQENDSRWILNEAPTGSMGQSCSLRWEKAKISEISYISYICVEWGNIPSFSSCIFM